MKVDIDELERKNAYNDAINWHDDNEEPRVVLALIARIRELEMYLGDIADALSGIAPAQAVELRAVATKGCVLP